MDTVDLALNISTEDLLLEQLFMLLVVSVALVSGLN